jgi:hypothetical protein
MEIVRMSDLTKLLRSNPVGAALLNAVEGEEKVLAPAVKAVATVAIGDVGAALNASAVVLLGSKLGPAATVPEHLVSGLIADFEAWLKARL